MQNNKFQIYNHYRFNHPKTYQHQKNYPQPLKNGDKINDSPINSKFFLYELLANLRTHYKHRFNPAY